MATFYDVMAKRIAELEKQGAGSLVPPAAILWTDRHREWVGQAAVLGTRRPVLTLGEFHPGSRTGPALWVRCVLARTILEDKLPAGAVPVVYLPGVAREDLRAVEDCPEPLRLLAELQYRSVFFSHPNGKDWSVAAWLSHKARGAGIDVATDAETREALPTAQSVLFEQQVESFHGRVLQASDLLELLVPDEIAHVLRWIDDEAAFKAGKTPEQWKAFVAQVASHFKFDIEGDGVLAAAERLAERQGEWEKVWSRFAEAPRRYPGVPVMLRRVGPSTLMPAHRDSWPQINDEAESSLREALSSVSHLPAQQARDRVAALEFDHGWRRASVWHELDETPLADALEHLANLAEASSQALGGASPMSIADAYAGDGWKVDDAYLRALGSVERATDVSAVQSCAAALYRPWVEAGARALQEVVGVGWPQPADLKVEAGTCVLFCDGLRFDLANRLSAVLGGMGVRSEIGHSLSALPTLTATAKPAVTPVVDALGGGTEFTPASKTDGKPATAEVLRSLMKASGWQVLDASDWGNPAGRAWTEMGDIDTLGHTVEAKMVAQIDTQLRLVADRVRELLASGWTRVVVVTDHGWLLMPDKLPKVELAKHLAEPRKGRCARLDPEAQLTDATIVPWSWDPEVRIAFAPGISTYVDGKRFDHGGISPQECVVPILSCTLPVSEKRKEVGFESVRWTGLRLRVALSGAHAGCALDLRRKAADATTSYVGGIRPVNEEGNGSLLVQDDSAIGDAAVLVALDSDGTILAQHPTVIGGDD